MPKIAKLPWQIRLLTLLVAAVMSMSVLVLYIFGEKFMAAVEALGRPRPAPAQFLNPEPGVVPVQIIDASKKKPHSGPVNK